MADGYGFGAEGDWKTCALLRAMKVMARAARAAPRSWRTTPTTSTRGPLVLGAHMLEICESIAAGKPSLEIHPLGIGGKEDPVRGWCSTRRRARRSTPRSSISATASGWSSTRSTSSSRPARCRGCRSPARLECRPDFKTACGAWIRAGGAHHTGFSYAVTAEHLRDFAEIAGIEIA
jgi:L-arabinose isomerase